MSELKDNLNDTKFLLEDSEMKSVNMEDNSILKNNYLNNTQLLLEDKTSILYEMPIDNNLNNNNNENKPLNNNNNHNHSEYDNDNNNDIKQNIDISIKEIMENNNNNREQTEKEKDEQEIIKQQNILLNNQSSHLEELFSLSYTELSHNHPVSKFPNTNKIISNNKNMNVNNNNYLYKKNNNNNQDKEKIKKIYFGVLFPTEQITKNISYQNDDKKKIICFKINNNKDNNYSEYFKILIDKNKNYFNLKSNEEVNIKILLEIPFLKNKKQINCELYILDINNNLIDSFFLYANVEIPKLCCLSYKNILKDCNIPLIKISTNLDDTQKFSVPFKNLSIKDLNINFFLLSSSNKEDDISKYIDYEIIFESEKNVNVPSCGVNYLEILLYIKKKKELLNNKNNNCIKIKKIIQANIVDTKINYYFCFELILINENINKDDKNEFIN